MAEAPSEARSRAAVRVRDRRALRQHAATSAGISVVLVVIWALTGAGLFWPGFVMAALGLSLVARTVRIASDRPITDEEIDRELQRTRESGG
jgi:UPF0716 family protein affecting phage T7 exclusion